MKKYQNFMSDIEIITKQIKRITNTKFKKEIKHLEKQEVILYEFLYNFNDNEIILEDNLENNSRLFIIINLFSDSLQSARIVRKLILSGEYNSAGALIRNLFETMLLINYIAFNESTWKDWLKYQNLEGMEMKSEKKSKELRQLRQKFSVSELIKNQWPKEPSHKITYGYLCLLSHASLERLKRVSEGVKETGFIMRYAPKFNEKIAEYYYKTLINIIHNTLMDFLSFVKYKEEPLLIKKYRKLIWNKVNGY